MTKGVFLCTWGKRGYGFAAYNLAFSIKYHSPDIHITLLCDESSIEYLLPDWLKVFDEIIPLPQDLRGKEPGVIKTSLYEFFPYDYTLFLDVDSVALKDINPLFDYLINKDGYYYTQILGTHTIDKGRDFPKMLWAWADDVWEHYQLPKDAVLPATNSSLQFIKLGEDAKALFKQIKANFDNPIPLHKLRMQWENSQPDELYLNIALAQKGIDADGGDNVFFGHKGRTESLTDVENNYYFLSIWGSRLHNRPQYTEYYDDSLMTWHRKQGKDFFTKYHTIYKDKHVSGRLAPAMSKTTVVSKTVELEKALLPISKSVLIDSSKLIQQYRDHNNRAVNVTCWLNCSFLQFKGKTYFAYRMEMYPFCTRMRIALCLLDDNLQPIRETNTLPNLYTNLDLRIDNQRHLFKNGFHAEDPRLFIYNDELYLSYTDGYQMAQAKINPASLQAEESFYIDKPDKKRTEKNWTFFDHQGKLLCVYQIAPHTIFEMNRANYSKVFETNFEHGWKWGIPRGGTSPVKHGDNYISFFHSAKDLPGGHRQYFMGAYIFEGKPPFKPLYISKEPIIAGEYQDDSMRRLSTKIYVVFPNGLIRKDNSWLVSFGYNDVSCRYIEIEDSLLKENLVEVKYKEEEVTA